MDHSKKSTYLFSIDALRVIAILGVILIHQSTTTLQLLNHDVTVGSFSLFFNQASRFAVPLFFLISGFVLELNNKKSFSYSTFFRKSASRILVPFIFWSAMYFYIAHGFDISRLLSTSFLEQLITGQAAYHLYFIPTLILYYLAFPFLHKLIKFIKSFLILTLIFLFQLLIAFFNYYVRPIPVHQNLQVALLVFSMFVIGMAASYYKTPILTFSKKYFLFLIALLISLSIYIFLHVYDIILKLKTSSFIYNQYGPLNYIYTIVLVLVLATHLERSQLLKNTFVILSKLSFFVFFIHVLVLQNIWVFVIKDLIDKNEIYFLKTIWFDPLVFTITCIISFVIAYIIHKIPYVSKITG